MLLALGYFRGGAALLPGHLRSLKQQNYPAQLHRPLSASGNLRSLGQRQEHDAFAGRGADIGVQTDDFDAQN